MQNIKVLIVDDSAFIRKMLRDLLEIDSSIQVVAAVKNGKEAIEYIQSNPVDVISLDVEMPVMDGIETLKEIMRVKPTPVVMLSSLTKEGAEMTFKALDLGAVNFLAKPTNIFKISSSTDIQDNIIDKVKEASKVRVSKITTIRPRDSKIINTQPNIMSTAMKDSEVKKIVAIGTSTGGPRALQEVVSNLSGDLPAPVLIVQHMPKGFTKSLADRLDSISRVKVKEAEDNEILENATAYIAPGDRHLKIEAVSKNKYRIRLDDGPNVSGHKPSVDALFYSLCDVPTNDIITVIMTGMGADGAKAMEQLKVIKNSTTIVEDESTCVVFGMPKSAIATGKVDKVLPLNKIANELNKMLGV